MDICIVSEKGGEKEKPDCVEEKNLSSSYLNLLLLGILTRC